MIKKKKNETLQADKPSFSNCYIIVHQFSTHAHFVSIKTNSIAQDH